MITREQVLTKWLGHWRQLKAWRANLDHVSVEISERWHPHRLGTCWPKTGRITIYRANRNSFDAATELDTLIHELAHAACVNEHHGVVWQETYSRAILEVTGISIPRCAANYRDLVLAGQAAVASWWKSSGNEFLFKLANAKQTA